VLWDAAFQNFQIGRSTRMKFRRVFTERLEVTALVERWRRPVSTRKCLSRSVARQRLKLWRKAENPVIRREARHGRENSLATNVDAELSCVGGRDVSLFS
jgi:hypothetical protein